MSKRSQSLMDVATIKQAIQHGGEFRVHLMYSRGGTVTARIWHPDGFKVGSAGGGGYDKQGTALGQAIELFFAEEMKTANVSSLYGAKKLPDGRVVLDGACGIECMLRVLEALGFKARLFETGKGACMVLAERA